MHNGADDFAIAGAATQNATDRIFDLLLVWARNLSQQGLSGHQHSRRTNTALSCALSQKRLLQPPVTGAAPVRQALNSFDTVTCRLLRRHHAGANGPGIDKDRAGSTIASITPDLSAR